MHLVSCIGRCRLSQLSTMGCNLQEAEPTNKLDLLSKRRQSDLRLLANATPSFVHHSLRKVADDVPPRLWIAQRVRCLPYPFQRRRRQLIGRFQVVEAASCDLASQCIALRLKSMIHDDTKGFQKMNV